MHARQPIKSFGFLLFLSLPLFGFDSAVQAQEGVPAPKTYAQADRQKPNAKPTQAEINRLNRRISALRRAGKTAAAIPLAQRAVRLTELRYGANDLRTATALRTLASLMVAQERYDDAETLLKRALAIQKRSKAAPGVLAGTYDALAVVAGRRGRAADAKKYSALAGKLRRVGRLQHKKAAAPKKPTAEKKYKNGGGATVQAKPKRANRARAREDGRRRVQTSEKQRPNAAETGQRGPPLGAPGGIAPRAPGSSGGGVFGAPPPGAGAPEPKAAKSKKEEAEAAGPPPAWDVVPVFYGTDRAEEPNPERIAYNSDRARRLELGRALVTVPKIHEVPEIERPWAIRIPYFDVTIWEETEDRNKHFTMQEIKKLTKAQFLDLVRARLAASDRFKDHALVFVHGYNTSFDNAIYRTAQIAYDLKFDGAPFLYSWPSGGAVGSYTWDRASAEASTSFMKEFLELVVKETGAKSVSIIAHSMGNEPLMTVLKDMKSSAPEGVVISQVILAAPDVDLDTFANLARAIKGLAQGVTLYAASNDRALMASRNFWGYYRAGDVPEAGPLVLPGIDTIDVTAASTDTFSINHSGYAQKNTLLQDIGELILTGLRPPDQRELHPSRIATEKGDYWRYTGRSD